ncbi:hypothetical protein KS4_23760 [Poriferisphaera corsica]|uniref:Uncharacterized protein n=1 Tax=Poriferisphaera corsica TaxID=2528020 RepID=A0A517YVR8_9BACT|nr:hypothetical protein [Poriferisphaera corsica]QDU34309.1 hypothetical protein KS4_23760 [Poriferisphaera corsica]
MNGDDVCGLLLRLGLDQTVFSKLPIDQMSEDGVLRLWMTMGEGIGSPQGLLVRRSQRGERGKPPAKPEGA